MFYVTLEVDTNDEKDADKIAQGISDTVGHRVVGCYPEFQTGLDNEGQVIIYTGHISETHGV